MNISDEYTCICVECVFKFIIKKLLFSVVKRSSQIMKIDVIMENKTPEGRWYLLFQLKYTLPHYT